MKKIISLFMSFTLVFLLAFTSVSQAAETSTSSYKPSSVKYGDYMYYAVYNKIYKVNVKTKNSYTVKTVSRGKFSDLVVKDGWIYCTLDTFDGTGDAYPYIYKVKTNGKKAKVLTKGGSPFVYKNKIYYIKASFTENDYYNSTKTLGIYKMNLDGSNNVYVKKMSNVIDFTVYKSRIYYCTMGSKYYLKRMTLSGGSTTTIASSSSRWIYGLKGYSGYIYFDYGDDIYRVKTNSTAEKRYISDAELGDISNSYIYYIVDKNGSDYLYKKKIGSSTRTYVTKKDLISDVNVSSGYILMNYHLLYTSSDYNSRVYICTTSGKSGKVLAKYYVS